MATKWTEESIEFLKKYYENLDYSMKEIKEALGMCDTSIINKASSLGLSRRVVYPADATHKVCGMCKQKKEMDAFHKVKSRKDGRHNVCRECCSIKKRMQRRKEEGTTKVCSVCGQEKPAGKMNGSRCSSCIWQDFAQRHGKQNKKIKNNI